MYTGEFINLKCTWITHDINGLWINDNYNFYRNPAHTETILSYNWLSHKGQNYMDFL